MKALRWHKYLQFNESKKKDILGFDKNNSDKYIPFSFLFYQTKSNRLSNLGKWTKILTHLISLKKNNN